MLVKKNRVMSTPMYINRVSSIVAQLTALTISGAHQDVWSRYFRDVIKCVNCSPRRKADLRGIYVATYSAYINQCTIFVYTDKQCIRYTTAKSNTDNAYTYLLGNGELISTTEQLHDRLPHLTSAQWDSMKKTRISKVTSLTICEG